MLNEKAVINADAKLRKMLAEFGFEAFISALRLFAQSRGIEAEHHGDAGLAVAWCKVEQALRRVEQLQDEADLREAWATFNERSPETPVDGNGGDFSLDWQAIAAALDMVNSLEDKDCRN